MRQMFFERSQYGIESLYMSHLQDDAVNSSQFRKLGSMCSIVGNRFFYERMLALGKESPGNLVVTVGGRCHRSSVNHCDEIIEGFGTCRAEFACDGAAPD